MIPRDYQRAAVDAAREKTGLHGNTMLVLPTGAGKTAIVGFYIDEEVEDTRDARVLVLQHEHVRDLNPRVKVLGLSATPSRGEGRSLRKTFTNVGYQLKIYAANCHLNFRWNRAAITDAVLKDIPRRAA